MPPVSPASITLVKGIHPNWNGDLLVSTLVGGALFRLILEDDRILGQEELDFGVRLRAVHVAHGRIYFLDDDGVLGYLTPRQTDVENSETGDALAILKAQGCIECHSKVTLPSLTRILGFPIGKQTGIDYSAAMARVPDLWTKETLFNFLRDPNKFVPGTSMPKPSSSDADLLQIIDAIETLTQPK